MFKFLWRQPGGLEECPYFFRTIFSVFGYSIRLHEWKAGDDIRHMHDHPNWFLTLVLKGGYTDKSDNEDDILRFGSIRFRAAEYRHIVTDVLPDTYTILIMGKFSRRWGFWVKDKLIKRDKYFAVHGHHPCDPLDKPVRLKPGGGRIE